MKTKTLVGLATLAVLFATSALAANPAKIAPATADPALHDEALALLKAGIAFKTVVPGDQVPAYAAYLKTVLVKAGYRPDEITIEPAAGSAFLIARYPGTDPSRKAIIISGHMDVVAANPADWTRDPFTPVVENGWIYGRGAVDDKFDVSMVVTVLAKLRREGWKPGRDLILALSGDEETHMATTAILAQRLKAAELVLNTDGGGAGFKDGRPTPFGIQGAEKTYADFTVEATDPGGHSSRPTPTNAIYRLARALDRIAAYRFPTMQNEITKAMFAADGAQTPGPLGEAMTRFAANPGDQAAVATLSADVGVNPSLRTTCVATMLSGGHAPNALPQKASATVNCRIFPGTPSETVRKALATVIADPTVTVTRQDDGSIDSPASPLRPDVVAAVTKAVHARYPGLKIVPAQDNGASDSMYFRSLGVPSYGVSGLFMEDGQSFIHGLNEKAPVAAIDGDLAHWESLLKDLGR